MDMSKPEDVDSSITSSGSAARLILEELLKNMLCRKPQRWETV